MPAENGMPENEDVRKKALLRLAVAGIVTAAALAGLWWLDQGGSEPKKVAPKTSLPAPIVAAPAPQVPAPEPEVQTSAPEGTVPDQATPSEATTALQDQTIQPPSRSVESAPPPPKVSNALRKPPAPQQVTPPAPLAPTSVAPPPVAQAAAPQATPGPSKSFVVQLGVFSNPDNARELVEKLKKQGIRAHLEARVQLGPFLNRQEAEKAQMEMRKLGYNALVTLPYPTLPATK